MMNEFDHRVLGAKYNLFSFFEEGPGMPVWHDLGLKIKNSLIDYWREVHREARYVEIQSPIMLDKELWKRSGHLDYFEENMYFSSVDKREYAIKPMSCPGAILLFKNKKRSFAELPLRISELGLVHRNEPSGSLSGLLRVRSFMQDDGHIFCRKNDLVGEIRSVIELMQKMMKHCGLNDYHFELSLKGGDGKNFMGSDEDWILAEGIFEKVLNELSLPVKKNFGEAKFYGPSLDLHIKDVHGRYWQCSTLQLDFNLPSRFDLHFFNEKGQKEVPLMLHRAIYGSLERFVAILLENFGKNLPFWMHPVQYKILSISSAANDYAKSISRELARLKINIELDIDDLNLKEKIKRSHEEFVHSLILVGEKEEKEKIIVLKRRGKNSKEIVCLNKFLKEFLKM